MHVSRKTAFLLLLASGARRNEIHALDYSMIIKSKDGKEFWLKPNPQFMAKNFDPATGKRRFEGFEIQSLAMLANQEKFDNALCPVLC